MSRLGATDPSAFIGSTSKILLKELDKNCTKATLKPVYNWTRTGLKLILNWSRYGLKLD